MARRTSPWLTELKVVSSRFERAASRPADEPKAPGPDVVFAGRSNVGKSSLINRLLGTKGLARTSGEPGRTRSVNFYRVNESCYFVDLPGYGWARVPLAVREAWKPMIEGFLERRSGRIALAFLIVDSRREATELDAMMREWLDDRRIPYVVAATKADKLSGNQRARVSKTLSPIVGRAGVCPHPVLVSVRTGLGVRELWRHLDAALDEHQDGK